MLLLNYPLVQDGKTFQDFVKSVIKHVRKLMTTTNEDGERSLLFDCVPIIVSKLKTFINEKKN